MSFDWVAQQKAMQDWVEKGSGLPDAKVYWGEHDSLRPAGPAIMLRISNIAEIGDPWVDVEDNLLPFADKTVTAIDLGANTLAVDTADLETGVGPVRLDSSTDDPPAPLVEGKDHWLIVASDGHVQFAETFEDTGGGDPDNPVTPIDLQDAGTGTLTLKSTSKTTHANAAIGVSRVLLRVTLELRCHGAEAAGNNMAVALLQRIRMRQRQQAQKAILKAANIGLLDCERVRAILGTKDALLFEPRAYMDVHLCLAMSEEEAMQVIANVQGAGTVDPGAVATDFSVP